MNHFNFASLDYEKNIGRRKDESQIVKEDKNQVDQVTQEPNCLKLSI